MIKTYSTIFVFFIVCFLHAHSALSQGTGCAAGYPCDERGVGVAGTPCGNGEWESLLVTQESGGNYGAEAGTSSALGRYQFIDDTRHGTGTNNNLPCSGYSDADRAGFASCPGLQDDYARALWQEDYNTLMSNSSVANAVNSGTTHECPVTESGLVALAHNVGPTCAQLWAEGGAEHMWSEGPVFDGVPAGTPGCTDANGTNAVEKYACAMGGFDMSPYGDGASTGMGTGCGFGYAGPDVPSAHFANSGLIGCDPDILKVAEARTDLNQQLQMDAAKAIIQPPTPLEITTCFDQTAAQINASTGIHSNPEGSSASFVEVVEQPLEASLQQFFDGTLTGSITAVVNDAFTEVTQAFDQALGGLTGSGGSLNVPDTNCEMQTAVWEIANCIQIPEIPSFDDIVGGAIGELTGAISDIPGTITGEICEGSSDLLGDAMNDVQGKVDAVTDSLTTPLTDAANSVDDIEL